jgi:hypothetical protein
MAALSVLSGCAPLNTARQWWQVWRNPLSVAPPANQLSVKVRVDLQEIAKRHPAWKLAEQLESSPPSALKINWTQARAIAITNSYLSKSTFAPLNQSTFASTNSSVINPSFAESVQLVTASNMDALNAQMSKEQQSAWEKWRAQINENLQEDRQQIGRAMRVDLNDRIDQTQKNIPETSAPLTPPTEIQNEMINLRLKLLNNITLSPDDKVATQKRLDQLEAQWTKQLRQQAQQSADKQQYWRETVPRQLRLEGEANIQQTLELLQQKDEKAIDLSINRQQNWLEQDNAQNQEFLLKLPVITNQLSGTKSTFHPPMLLKKSFKSNLVSIPAPTAGNEHPAISSLSEILQLKQVAVKAAANAATQSAARHHWQWTSAQTKDSSTLPDVTQIVLRESNF